RLLDAGVGGRRLAHEERADEDGRQDDRDGDRQDEGQRRERAPALEGAAEPRRQRVEGERQDRRPHERDEEGREEEVELVEEEEEDGEEESREELLPRHRAATVAVAALDHKAHRRRRRVALTPRGGVGTKTPLRRCAQARSSVGERFLDTEEAGGSIPPVPTIGPRRGLSPASAAAHLIAQAVQPLFPETHVTIGPVIENGFYYDFKRPGGFASEDLPRIEEMMRAIVAEDLPVRREEVARGEAIRRFREMGEHYKVEIIEGIPDATVSLYHQGELVDLCRGPHVPST